MQNSTNSFIKDGMWDLVEEAQQWQQSAHPPLTKDRLLHQTFMYDSGWDESTYPENDEEVYGEGLTMEAETGSSSVNAQVSVTDDEMRDSNSDSFN